MSSDTAFAESQQAIQENLVSTIRATSSIASQDIAFHRSLNPSVTASLDAKQRRLLKLTERLLQRSSTGAAQKISLPNADAIDDKWKSLVDAADGLFERTDACIDEYSGLIQKQTDCEQEPKQSPAPASSRDLNSALRRPNLHKPQLDFEAPSFNHETAPFKPFLTKKPNSVAPFEQNLSLVENEYGTPQYQHPYQHEITAYNYPAFVSEQVEPQMYPPFSETSAIFVDDEQALKKMLKKLKKAKEIAIDLEHHDYRSYIGVVSLMQISTRDQDWIVDTLKPWRRNLEALNEVFTHPDILKVFHGAHMDVIWLQRDLGLYLVGLFDTHFAARVLGYPGKSLAYLLKRFVDFDAQKQYQTADWRIRPLPAEMFDYARSDTHFLLYIYDCMRNELINKSHIKTEEGQDRDCIDDVLQLSNEQCLQRYEHPFYNDSPDAKRYGWAPILARHPGHLTQEQIAVYARIHKWRDTIARDEDESVAYVMPNHVLMNITRGMPNDKPALLAISHPISPIVKRCAGDIIDMIRDARANAQSMPDLTTIVAAQYGDRRFTLGDALAKVKAEAQAPPVEAPPVSISEDFAPRMQESQLWGGTLHGVDGKPTETSTYNIQLGDPTLTQAATDEHRTNGFSLEIDTPNKQAEASVNGTSSPASKLLGKRKSQPAVDDMSMSDSEEDRKPIIKKKSAKAQARAERKAAKHAKENVLANKDLSSVPFDYSAQPSILHPPKEARDAERKREKKSIPNPYARAEQAAPGLKRARMQNAGRSATFKS